MLKDLLQLILPAQHTFGKSNTKAATRGPKRAEPTTYRVCCHPGWVVRVNSAWETIRVFIINQLILLSNLNLEFVFQGKRATRTRSSEPLRPRHTRLVHKFNTASLRDNIMRSIFKTYLIISTKFHLWHYNLLISQHCQLCGKSEVKTKVKDGLSSFFGCLLTGRQSISENTGGGTFAWLRVLY